MVHIWLDTNTSRTNHYVAPRWASFEMGSGPASHESFQSLGTKDPGPDKRMKDEKDEDPGEFHDPFFFFIRSCGWKWLKLERSSKTSAIWCWQFFLMCTMYLWNPERNILRLRAVRWLPVVSRVVSPTTMIQQFHGLNYQVTRTAMLLGAYLY